MPRKPKTPRRRRQGRSHESRYLDRRLDLSAHRVRHRPSLPFSAFSLNRPTGFPPYMEVIDARNGKTVVVIKHAALEKFAADVERDRPPEDLGLWYVYHWLISKGYLRAPWDFTDWKPHW